MVNAVLRSLARGRDRGTKDLAEASNASGQLAVRYSHPAWIVSRWLDRFGPVPTEALLRHNNRKPPVVVQPLAWTGEQLAGALMRSGIGFDAIGDDLGFAIHDSGPVTRLPGFAESGFLVQDPAQAQVVRFANFLPGSVVWDACAAPGGKSLVLSRRHRMLSSDIKHDRLQRVRSTAQRSGSGLSLFVADGRTPPLAGESLDGILLDVPCSATGAMARHPDARWRLSPRRIQLLAQLQAALLEGAASVLRRGGLLVYATCSLESEENEHQVNQFLERHPDYRRTADDLVVFPPDSGSDGAYAARLERAA